MKDTTDAIDRKYREMLLQRSGEERLKMGCSMHSMARALVLASARRADPSAWPADLKKILFFDFTDRISIAQRARKYFGRSKRHDCPALESDKEAL